VHGLIDVTGGEALVRGLSIRVAAWPSPPGIARDPHGVATSIPGGASLEKSAVL
jgi:hypothetical protein